MEINKSVVQKIAASSGAAKEIFDVLANRPREPRRGVTDLRRIRYDLKKKGLKILPEEFIEPFLKLQAARLGEVIRQPDGRMEFKWNRSVKDIMAAANEAVPAVKKTAPSLNVDPNLHFILLLGPGRKASFSFPADITQEEANFLSGVLRELVK